jgi:hypothetical protein
MEEGPLVFWVRVHRLRLLFQPRGFDALYLAQNRRGSRKKIKINPIACACELPGRNRWDKCILCASHASSHQGKLLETYF